jgi:acyl-CoA thioesterase FadM
MGSGRPPVGFSALYRVRFDESDASGALRASAHLRYVQDIAWQHSTAAGFDMAWYASQNRFWLVRYLELWVLAPVPYGGEVEVSTEVVIMRRAWARRVSEFHLPGGQLAATARVDWMMTNGQGSAARIPEAMAAAFPVTVPDESPGRVELAESPVEEAPAVAAVTAVVRWSELDPMGHMNNAAYLDHLEEAVYAAGGTALLDSRPRRYRLEFLAPAGPQERLTGHASKIPSGWAYRLAGEAGTVLLRGVLDRPGERAASVTERTVGRGE